MAQAKRILGDEMIAESTGHFWLIIETRSYMRVLMALAEAYTAALQRQRAVACYEQALLLCPSDNLGARYLLCELYLTLQQASKAIALIDQFNFDDGTQFKFSYVIALFMLDGVSDKVRKALIRAHRANSHVIPLLLQQQAMPKTSPEYYSDGDFNEAVIYAENNLLLWRNVPNLLSWLADEATLLWKY